MERYTLGLDFGSDSVRCLVVSCKDGKEISSSIAEYPRWKQRMFCKPEINQYRQHPADYIEAMGKCIKDALSRCSQEIIGNIIGMCIDTTASTPALTDKSGTPLALLPEYENNPDAMFVLWKDHTAIGEADRINEISDRYGKGYTRFSGGKYSCEWVWAKMLHCLNHSPELKSDAYSWAEHCDWITGLLAGNTKPETLPRSRCAAGHKALWHASWNGLPELSFWEQVDPQLLIFKDHLYTETSTCDMKIGGLCKEWAARTGLKEGIAISAAGIDCHVGAVGAGIRDGRLVKVVGTSTCDIATVKYEKIGEKTIGGICGQVDGSVMPGRIGLEAGQSAFGDIYGWFKGIVGWGLQFTDAETRRKTESMLLDKLSAAASELPVSEDDIIALDWHNGRRSPDAEPRAKGAVSGLTLASSAPVIFKSLVEATAFGSKAINERLVENGIEINEIVAVGGISRKSPYVMQTMANVLGIPIKVLDCDQACALGGAIFAAVAAGEYTSVLEAQEKMCPGFSEIYLPDEEKHNIYKSLYRKYKLLGSSDIEIFHRH